MRQKEDVPSILQDTWQHNHNTDSHSAAASSSQKTCPSEDRIFLTGPKQRLLHKATAASSSQKTRSFEGRTSSTSLGWSHVYFTGWKLRLHPKRRVPSTVVPVLS